MSGRAMAGLVVALAAVGTLVASSSPDGLERVARDLGFEDRATSLYQAPLDYGSGALAGVVGAAVVGGLAYAVGRWLVRPSQP